MLACFLDGGKRKVRSRYRRTNFPDGAVQLMDHTVAVMNTEVATGVDGYSNSKVFEKTVLKYLGMLCANRTNASEISGGNPKMP